MQAKAVVAWVETILGLLFVFIVGFALPAILLLYAFIGLSHEGSSLARAFHIRTDVLKDLSYGGLVVGLVACLIAYWIVRMAIRATDGQYGDVPQNVPLAVAMGLQLPRFPLPLRFLLGAWWLVHFAVGCAYGIALGFLPITQPDSHWALKYLLPMLVTFPLVFAANVYFMLAVAVFYNKRELLRRTWQCRLLIDALVTLIPLVVAMWR
jgi:hypothetical protein